MSDSANKIRPFSEGKAACLIGKKPKDNPYPKDYKGPPGYKNVANPHDLWSSGFESQELDNLIEKTPFPDHSLIAQCEILIPRSTYWCGHELPCFLHHYIEACDGQDKVRMINCERTLRRTLVKAKLEAAGEQF